MTTTPAPAQSTNASRGPRLSTRRLTPEVYEAMSAFDDANGSRFDPVIRELVNIRVSQINGCAFCIDMHTLDARAAGETEQRIYALSAWRETPFFSARERAALEFAEAATKLGEHGVPDEVFEEAARHFDEVELAQLIWRVAVINAWNRVAITSGALPGMYRPVSRS